MRTRRPMVLCRLIFAVAVAYAAMVPAAAASDDVGITRQWLSSAAKDVGVFESVTAFPFTYRTTSKDKRCERVIRDRRAFSKWAACFRKDQKLLIGEITAGTAVQKSSPSDLGSPEVRAMVKTLSGDGRWVYAFMNGAGITFELSFRVTGHGDEAKVNAVILREEVERG